MTLRRVLRALGYMLDQLGRTLAENPSVIPGRSRASLKYFGPSGSTARPDRVGRPGRETHEESEVPHEHHA